MEPDQLNKSKSIYEASTGEIFFKNFLAGFSRSLGSISIYLIFLVVLYSLLVNYVLPEIQPFIIEYRQAIEAITQLQSTTGPGTTPDSNQYKQFLQDLNSSLPIAK